ncbi:MAG: histidinol-phosphatase HisN [Roseibaca calidilacus]|uniref:Histidinol-phosphatase n=1 Tax=Roseibaca calidilacus TaxID=1666912 RepID=A0A0P7WX07_9RHOB|nr:histidinol-phosphatase [Roseibaca calidilacus]KPP95831.1 MAG: histidinol-phosphatase HisN [Roseibaca calidilacus]CUX81635.1 histidinol-phosphatase, inositol monophosphatase family [Roseibaca calidilacus]
MRRADLTDKDITSLIALCNRLADVAGTEALRYFRTRDLTADNKLADGFDPVTQADRAAEAAMRKILDAERPADAVLGEEHGARPGTSGLKWVLDPIDGTRAYISGTATWGVLIALCDAEGPFLGVIDQPYTGERFVGGLGQAHLSGPRGTAPLQTRATHELSAAILFSTFPEIGTEAERAAFQAVSAACKLTRYGMDCYAYGLLAAGHIDLVIEAGLNSYDICAPIAVIEAAGGIVTDWQGGPAHAGGQVLAAANADLHAAALARLQQKA